jgi:hypothetical protein
MELGLHDNCEIPIQLKQIVSPSDVILLWKQNGH